VNQGYRGVSTPDGRTLEVLTGGDPDGFPLLFHGGSPSAAVRYEPFDRAVREAGLRSITYSRPGYGDSTAHPRPEPRMVDDVADSLVVLDALGVDRFVTAGWSGGGPRALGCAALLSDRCLAAASIAGVGPHDGEGLDWKGGMAEENVVEYTAAEAGRDAYAAFVEGEFLPVLLADADDLAESLGGLLPPADKAAMDREFTEWLTKTFHRAGAQRIVGVLDDGQAAVRPWGFDVGAITVPVLIYQGRQDAMVPFAHGEWLAAHVPGAEVHLTEEDGHLTPMINGLPGILADLKRVAGLPST
jgi:pimeloyl-ACP methyl ester carboxylesterase